MSSESDQEVDRTHSGVRSRGVGVVLVAGVIACGVFGALSAAVAQEGPEIERKVGVTALLALILAGNALVRRSWARLPLVVACWCACSLASDAFFESERDPSLSSYVLGYLFLNAVMVLAAAAALVVLLLDSARKPSP